MSTYGYTGITKQAAVGHTNIVACFKVDPTAAPTASATLLAQTQANSDGTFTLQWGADLGSEDWAGRVCVVVFDDSNIQKLRSASNDWIAGIVGTALSALVVAGGGGGGGKGGGGGGGGQVIHSDNIFSPLNTVHNITIGAGGTGGLNEAVGSNGGDSALGTLLTALGGGGGGHWLGFDGLSGGTGGGGGKDGGAGGTGLQFNGGTSLGAAGYAGGGGAGAGADGEDGLVAEVAGNGGAGASNSITGTVVLYAGGGGGGTNSDVVDAKHGLGTDGGGNAGANDLAASNGITNTGSGGGAGGYLANTVGGNGGSGQVLITAEEWAATITGTPDVSMVDNKVLYTFNADGSISFDGTDPVITRNLTELDSSLQQRIELPPITLAGDFEIRLLFQTSGTYSQYLFDYSSDLVCKARIMSDGSIDWLVGDGVNWKAYFMGYGLGYNDSLMHLARFKRLGNAYSIVVDGVELISTANTWYNTVSISRFGNQWNSINGFDGIIADVEIWDAGTLVFRNPIDQDWVSSNIVPNLASPLGVDLYAHDGLTGWQEPRTSSTLSVVGDVVRSTADNTSTHGASYQLTGLTIGVPILVAIAVDRGTSTGQLILRYDDIPALSNPVSWPIYSTPNDSSGIINLIFTPTATTMYVGAVCAGHAGGEYFEIAVDSIKEAPGWGEGINLTADQAEPYTEHKEVSPVEWRGAVDGVDLIITYGSGSDHTLTYTGGLATSICTDAEASYIGMYLSLKTTAPSRFTYEADVSDVAGTWKGGDSFSTVITQGENEFDIYSPDASNRTIIRNTTFHDAGEVFQASNFKSYRFIKVAY